MHESDIEVNSILASLYSPNFLFVTKIDAVDFPNQPEVNAILHHT